MTDEPRIDAVVAASTAEIADELRSSDALDELFARIRLRRSPADRQGRDAAGLINAALERGLQAELSDHLGYDKGDPDAQLFPNSRNGSTPKTMATEVGPVPLDVPRDRDGSFTPQLG